MTSLFRASAESETRTLTRIGAAGALTVVIAIGLYVAVTPFMRSTKDVISVTIEMPYVGQGVADGTPMMMHGVKVGEVTSVSNRTGGGVRLRADLQPGPTAGLTDTLGIDFRPSNYFGLTGLNLTPGEHGRPLHSGALIVVNPKGNFTLQALLYRLGELSNQVITQRLVNVLERVTRYTDALNPLLETMMIAGSSLTRVQTVSTKQLLRNATGISVAFPTTTQGVIDLANGYLFTSLTKFSAEKDYKNNPFISTYDDELLSLFKSNIEQLEKDHIGYTSSHDFQTEVRVIQTDLFSRVGNLLSTHVNDLYPTVEMIRVFADVAPAVVDAEGIEYTTRELRSRFERMYAGSGDQRALQVRIVLDSLPGVAAPLGLALGGSQ